MKSMIIAIAILALTAVTAQAQDATKLSANEIQIIQVTPEIRKTVKYDMQGVLYHLEVLKLELATYTEEQQKKINAAQSIIDECVKLGVTPRTESVLVDEKPIGGK